MTAVGRRLAWLALGASVAAQAAAPVRIGSKNFTESVVLGEIARVEMREAGVDARHQREIGGTRILWRALEQGEIDVYPEYLGTITHELLRELPADAGIDQLRPALAAHGIGITPSLGFSNSYALGMRGDKARELGAARISDLDAHAELRVGVTDEFLQREDGWPGLVQRYALPQKDVRTLDHDLAYRALADGAIDVMSLFSTDAEIAYYRLAVLDDDRRYFPRYDAVFLYRLDLAQRGPGAVAALEKLAGRIDVDTMRRLNAQVKLEHRDEAEAAAGFLGAAADSASRAWLARLAADTLAHLRLVAISLGLALVFAVPLGIFAARLKRLGQIVIGATGILQTVPSLAMFVFMIPLFGIGAAPAIAALFLYSLLPIVRNTHAGLTGIAPNLIESAAALGLPPRVRLVRVELPLALRSILAGVKTAAIINVGTATLGALIGAGGYGQPILTGIRLDDIGLILQGAVPAALMALAVQALFEGLERLLTPRGLRLQARV